ncbi:5'-nucleotidase-like [Zophobas morio]|uniref:5'-nucleotidase-like n=1 Tax=Zophobas morio TaxID=2755281 RepID=UPI00308394FA
MLAKLLMEEVITFNPLRILTVNDIYCEDPSPIRGGYATLATMLRMSREEVSKSVTVVAGDVLGGSSLTTFFEGSWVVDVFQELKVDFACVGNHEFDYGAEVLEKLIAKSNFIWFAANVRNKDGSLLKGAHSICVRHYEVTNSTDRREVVSIGFFGVCSEDTPNLSFPGNEVVFTPVLECVRDQVSELKNCHNVDYIVALTHLDLSQDIEIARNVKGINLIIGGHNHEPYTLFEGDTMIFKAGVNAYWLGVIDLTFTASYKKFSNQRKLEVFHSWSMKVNIGYEPDVSVYNILKEKYNVKADYERANGMNKVLVSRLPFRLDTKFSTVRSKSCAMGGLIADAIRAQCRSDLALINGGFIRGDRIYEKGSFISARDIIAELPFKSKVVSILVSGEQLKNILEERPPGERLQVFTVNNEDVVDRRNYSLGVTVFSRGRG